MTETAGSWPTEKVSPFPSVPSLGFPPPAPRIGSMMGGIMKSRTLVFGVLASIAIVSGPSRAANTDPNNPTGTRGLILIDKVGRHLRFLDPTT